MLSQSTKFRRGVTSIEYALLTFLIILGLIAILSFTGVNLNNVFSGIASDLNNSSTGSSASQNSAYGGP